MHGGGLDGGELKVLSRHMWPVSSTTTTVTSVADSNGSSASCLLKDGRKISAGDCALFKPAKDYPPFVGIIRSWQPGKDSNLTLSVGWLYRPAEIKLLKGVAFEAAPNEVFYSFHSDEIPAASLLHPCKIAFLPKGVELPPGVSSFVCRRVYDITNKCLWWLTDQNYINDRQEEVDQLLNKTRIEMHASVEQQQGSRSPRLVNGSVATPPLSHSSDSLQNGGSNLSSHKKGKKRERGDQSFDAIKRVQSSRTDDGDSGQLRSDNTLNSEIAKFTEKGGLMDSEAVVRLVRFMQPEKAEKKVDLTGRSMLAGLIAATDKLDCLHQFVQLKGLHVLNEWLQEVHKGKIGHAGNLKHSDKPVDDFLLVLLRALDKLPVNLNALQGCNIGKSVNHLRSHKNSDIQKKARSLVDTWKKRVEAEMNINDVRPGSSQAVPWSGKSQHDSSHGGIGQPSGSDAAIRSSITHDSSLKSASVKFGPGDLNSKSASAYPSGARSTLSPTSTTDSCKDGQPRNTVKGGSFEPQSMVREEKSCSSGQSLTNSQCSNDQAKTMVPCGKEDTRTTAVGSRSLNKSVCSSSKLRKHDGPSSSSHTAANRSPSMARNIVVEKVSHNATEASVPESNNHKLIVKISNRGRGPAENITGGYLEDSSCRISRASSPAHSEKLDQSDATSVRGINHDPHQFHEVDVTSNSGYQRTSEIRKLPYVSRIACSPSRSESKSRKVHDSSFSSMNALIESCAKLSEANVILSAGDDVGMNLLASVAAGEIPKAGIVSPAASPHRNSKMDENSCSNHVENLKQLYGDDVQQGSSTDVADMNSHSKIAGLSKVDQDNGKFCGAKSESIHQRVEICLKNNGTLEEKGGTASAPVSVTCTTGKRVNDFSAETSNSKIETAKNESQNELPVLSQGLGISSEVEVKVNVDLLSDELKKKADRDSVSCLLNGHNEKSNVTQGLQCNTALEQKSIVVALQCDSMNTTQKPVMVSSGTCQLLATVISKVVKSENNKGVSLCNLTSLAENERVDKKGESFSVLEKQDEPGGCRVDVDQNKTCKDQNSEIKDASAAHSGKSAMLVSSVVALPEEELLSSAEGTKSTAMKEKTKENSGSARENVALSPAIEGPDADTMLGFDLNEGYSVEQKTVVAALQSDSMNTSERQVIASSGTSQAGNKILGKESDCSSVPDKQGKPGVCCADVDQNRSCNDQNSENKDASAEQSSSSATQVCFAGALPEKELCSSVEGTKSTAMEEESNENGGFATEKVALSPTSGGSDADTKYGFDLNEGINVDDGKNGEPINLVSGPCSDTVSSVSPLQIHVSSAMCGFPASITVAAAAKGPFVLPDDFLWNKRELGWKGSAATSAFRPAEPRKVMEVPSGLSKDRLLDAPACTPSRFPLDIDLNVADESSIQEFNVRNSPVCEEMSAASLRSSGGFDLDLNKVDEASDVTHTGQHMASNIQRVEVSAQHVKPSTLNVYSNVAVSGKRDFDLNDGPVTEDIPVERIRSSHFLTGNIPFHPSFGPRINSSDTGNCFSWYPPGSSYSVSMTPSVLSDREAFSIVGVGGGPQRVVGGPTPAMPFNPDAYSGSVLSSSPASSLNPAHFQYPVMPFGTNFHLPTSTLAGGSSGYIDPAAGGRISAIPSHLVGNTAAVSFQYPHAYVSRPILGVCNNGVISSQKWDKQDLDLNSGPGVSDIEGREESLPMVSRQVSTVISSQSLAEEHARMYSMAESHLKRKEPEGGWNIDKINYKQPSWQ